MKRQLTKREIEKTREGINRLSKEVAGLVGNLNYNKALIEKQIHTRNFDDMWRPYLRRRKDAEDRKVIKLMEEEIESKKKTVLEMKKHLKEGVEVKDPTGLG